MNEWIKYWSKLNEMSLKVEAEVPPSKKNEDFEFEFWRVFVYSVNMMDMFCSRCGDGFEPEEKIVNSNGELWHGECFVSPPF